MRPRLGAVAVLAILALLALMHVSAGQSVGAPSKPKAPPQLPPKPKAPPLPPKPPQPPKTPQPAQPPPSHPPKDRAAEDSGKQAEAAREAQAQAEEEAQSAAKAERERQQAVKAEARAIAEAAERKAQGQSAAAIAEEELVAQEQATAAAAAAAAEVAALTRNTAESDSTDDENAATDDAGDNDNEDDGGDGDREHGGDGEEADTNYVEPHIEVPGIPYMAADAHGGSHMEECHRSRTRLARSRLEKYFWPVIERNEIGFSLDESCPLMRNLDMLKPFESIKKMKRRGEWQCTGCNKLFRGEDFVSSGEMDCCNTPELDKHLSRKHMDLLNHSASTCLEDYCDILECDHDRAISGPPSSCDVADMKLLQHKCEALVRKCVPIERGTSVAKLSSIAARKLCGR